MRVHLFVLVEGNVNRWEKTVHETEEALQQKQNEEQKAKGDVERLMQLFDTMKKEISEFKQEIDKKVRFVLTSV